MDGFGDPRLRLSVNLYGAPALSVEQFASYRQNVIVGATLQVFPPLGQRGPVGRDRRDLLHRRADDGRREAEWSAGASTRTGTDFDTVGIAWQYRWGAGL